MRNAVVLAALLAVIAGPAIADDTTIGRFAPGLSASFNGGLTELNNSIGMSVGVNFAPFRFGPVRFPTVGFDLGAIYKCPYWGTDSECRLTGAALVSGGADFIVSRHRDTEGRTTEEKAISVAISRVVAGPLDDSWGVRIGMSFRFGGRQ